MKRTGQTQAIGRMDNVTWPATAAAAVRAFVLITVCAVSMINGTVSARDFEVGFAAEDFKRLDTYEAHTLSKADASFALLHCSWESD